MPVAGVRGCFTDSLRGGTVVEAGLIPPQGGGGGEKEAPGAKNVLSILGHSGIDDVYSDWRFQIIQRRSRRAAESEIILMVFVLAVRGWCFSYRAFFCEAHILSGCTNALVSLCGILRSRRCMTLS